MNKIYLSISILLFIQVSCMGQTGLLILNNMLNAIDSVHSLEFDLTIYERMENEYIEEYSLMKVVFDPYSVYSKQYSPNKDLEAFFTHGENSNKVKIKTNTFPYLTLNLDPFSSQMRKGRHHAIYESGVINYMASAIKGLQNKEKNNLTIDYKGMFKINERLCYKIVINNPVFKTLEYTVKPGETLYEIAKRNFINEYMIVELNKEIADFNDIEPGQNIIIPSAYAKTMELNIDKEYNLPILIKISDDMGLFEKYLLHIHRINHLNKAY